MTFSFLSLFCHPEISLPPLEQYFPESTGVPQGCRLYSSLLDWIFSNMSASVVSKVLSDEANAGLEELLALSSICDVSLFVSSYFPL